ncbi:beta strand repeat-containing protein [Acidiphilium sp.]|uniref:beta strand repeat-containing protein n=1 Tax=Acidiphilium sp. TaxID=527 RepID=UPI003D04F284
MNQKTVLAAAIGMLFSAAAAATPSATQMPGGGQVIAVNSGTTVNGGAVGSTITGLSSGAVVTLGNSGSSSPWAVIRWGQGGSATPAVPDSTNPQGFNIGSNSSMTFNAILPRYAGYGAVLNIDASGNPSEIDGTLNTSNLDFYLANGNGIVIGSGATINAAARLGLIGWNMNNTTAAADFVGENSGGASYLDFGNIGTPGAITINNATLNVGSTQSGNDGALLLLGGSIVNNGVINIQAPDSYSANGFMLESAGWTPTKSTDTVRGVSQTPVYRVANLSSPYLFGSLGYINLIPGTGSYTITNGGSVSVTQAANSNQQTALLADSGITVSGSISSPQGPVILDTSNPSTAGASNTITINGTINAPTSGVVPDPSLLNSASYGYGQAGYNTGTAGLAIYAPGSQITLGSNAALTAGSMVALAHNLQGTNGTYPITANDLSLFITGTINGGANGTASQTNYLANGLGINPTTTGGSVAIHLWSAASANDPTTVNYVNLNVNGSATVDSGGTWSPIASQINNSFYNSTQTKFYYPLQVDNSGNYSQASVLTNATFSQAAGEVANGGSLIIQATDNLTLVGGSASGGNNGILNDPYSSMFNNSFYNKADGYLGLPYGSNLPFVFSGGVVFKAGQSVTVNVPVLNAWGSKVIAYQGVFLESPVISVNNQAFFVTGPAMRVNVSSTPTTGVPAVYLESGGSMTQSPSNFNPALGSGVYKNSYSTLIAAYLADPATWTSVVNNTPM